MAGGDFPGGTIVIDLNPILLAIQLTLDILEWTGVIPDPISLLIGALAAGGITASFWYIVESA